MNILLINPEFPDTYWSFKHAIKFISKKAVSPPLGLLTVAAMLPEDWERKLVDTNIEKLREKDIKWADYIFLSAMSVQSESADAIIDRCQKAGRKVVAGGPHFTGNFEKYNHVDHLILNEAELTFPEFLAGYEANWPWRVYSTKEFADMRSSPVPDYSLIDVKQYAQVPIQFSRGCPYDCEFCEITALLGRKFRTKESSQILLELDNIYNTGFRGSVFFVDDNFIGNKKKLKEDLLPAIIEWNTIHRMPFSYTTEASIDLSDDQVLIDMMSEAGFVKVFVGIETPDEDSLRECNKRLNLNRDLVKSVKSIQNGGIEVSAGFIVGFDNDKPGVFERQISFIQESGIITAMVGLLNAPSRTRLYKRLQKEGRITGTADGNNTNYSINFIPRMDKEKLLAGYKTILNNIYSGKAYHERVLSFINNYKPRVNRRPGITMEKFGALIKSIWTLGIVSRNRRNYWKLFFWSLFNRPDMLPLAITYSVYGYHFRKVFGIKK
ncbi:MAG: B12-binding domain-containing radical SAM protein [Bacteroidales bacterium]|nr:B12-binding domain-containing radical SAM protein [Bacteroidales bacterium]